MLRNIALSLLISIFITSTAAAQQAPTPGTGGSSYFLTGSDNDTSVVPNLFIDISGTGAILVSGDDVSSGAVALGMDTYIFGERFDALNFATNGYITTDLTDSGPDLSNDGPLPQTPSTPVGTTGHRIYPHHDDTVHTIYGQYFSAGDSAFGTEMFVSQFRGHHFAGGGPILYNVIILRDGTIISAHEFAGPETGSGATVGIQKGDLSEGYAYSYNSAGSITDGQTNIFIPEENGISDDLTILAIEQGIATSSLIGGNIAGHAAGALGGVTEAGSTNGSMETASYRSGNIWLAGLASYSDGDLGSDFDMERFGGQIGIDLYRNENVIVGISGGYTTGSSSSGQASVDAQSWSVVPYVSVMAGSGWLFSASLEYTLTDYSNYDLPFLTGLEAKGRRWAGHVEASKDFSLASGLIFTPRLAFTAGAESISDWKSNGGMKRPVENASFTKTELTGKLSKQFAAGDGAANGYLFGGADYITSNGDDKIALYSTDYTDARLSGVVGAGLEFVSGNRTVSIEAKANGLGSDVTSYSGTARIGVSF